MLVSADEIGGNGTVEVGLAVGVAVVVLVVGPSRPPGSGAITYMVNHSMPVFPKKSKHWRLSHRFARESILTAMLEFPK